MQKVYSILKNIIDKILAIIILTILSPLLVVTAIFVKLDAPNEKVIFKQIRTGKGNNPFTIYKFRSMKKNDKKKHTEIDFNNQNWKTGVPDDFIFKVVGENSEKLSKTGYFIRKFSLDELPQFFNVLIGNMSLVGPRPEIPEITKFYSAKQMQRLWVKPGITGWAQVNGRSNMTHGEKIEFDRFYVKNFNLMLDLRIFFSTIYLVVTGKDSV